MVKDYPKKVVKVAPIVYVKQGLLLFVVFLTGYLGASVFDVTRVLAWLNTTDKQVANKEPQQVKLPQPKLEFYTLLENERVMATSQTTDPVAEPTPVAPAPVTIAAQQIDSPHIANQPSLPPVVVATATAVPVVAAKPVLAANKQSYLIQVAAFKNRQDAERMKATLSMKGFDVNIATINQRYINWYRVIIGPFASRDDAERAQMFLVRSERIHGMIRKMDA